MDKIKLPNEVKDIMDYISKTNEVFLVGGAVRDIYLGNEVKDYDLTTNMDLELIKKKYPNFIIMRENNHRNTGIIRLDNIDIEISTFRGDNIKEDIFNRDFTINSLIIDKDGNIIDYYNGINDINNKQIKLIKDNGDAFIVDPLRILRAIRLSIKLGFNIDNNTKEQMIMKKDLLKTVDYQRIYKELIFILMSDKPSIYIDEYKEIFFSIIPELKETYGFNQCNTYWHNLDVYYHILTALDNTPKILNLRLATLFHDIGKPNTFTLDDNNIGHFYEHYRVSTDIFEKYANLFKINHDDKKLIKDLIFYHDMNLSTKKNKIKRWYQIFGDNIYLLFLIKKADILAQNPELINNRLNELKRLENYYKEVIEKEPCISIKDLKISGRDLLDLPNKMIGIALKDVLNEVIENDLPNEREIELEYIKEKYF